MIRSVYRAGKHPIAPDRDETRKIQEEVFLLNIAKRKPHRLQATDGIVTLAFVVSTFLALFSLIDLLRGRTVEADGLGIFLFYSMIVLALAIAVRVASNNRRQGQGGVT